MPSHMPDPLLPISVPTLTAAYLYLRTYTAGLSPCVTALYPAVPLPVRRGTPRLAHRVGWDHGVAWDVADFRYDALWGVW